MSASMLFEPPDAARPESTSPAAPTSLYRKYRPQSFDDHELVGQEHVVRTLRNAIRLERVAHAYLFCGPRGSGKTTTARVLAKAVNCLAPDPARRPCNACANCLAIARGATTDIVEIDAASNRGIDDIRDLRERVKYAPSQLNVKFYIVDEAHQITGAAANAFLKTLEEPPTHTRFILATTDPEELLPTIVSRCQRFDFRRIGTDAMIGRLRDVADMEKIPITDDALAVIARHATGSLRDALVLLDQLALHDADQPDVASGPASIDADAVRAALGLSRNDRVEALVAALAAGDATAALATVNRAVAQGDDPRQLNRQLVAYLRQLLVHRVGAAADVDERAAALAARFDVSALADLARRFSDIDYRIKHSPYGQLPLEIALVEACLPAQPTATPAAQNPHPGTAAP
ncbi:MAG TPA: DNA polymerase III subunit gamma/tau, partial [Thermomicrobiales bacterium]|nr:DNA polymerase III subunit gamma/tau [Thermomicrobiales bacterium]